MLFLRQFLKSPQLANLRAFQEDYLTGEKRQINSQEQGEIICLVKEANVVLIDTDLVSYEKDDLALLFDRDIAPPFKTCWVELNGHDIRKNIPVMFYETRVSEEKKILTSAVGMLVHEKEPGLYDLFVFEMAVTDYRINQSSGGWEIASNRFGSNISVFRNVTAGYCKDQDVTAVATLRYWLEAMDSRRAVLGVEETPELIQVPRPERPHRTRAHAIRRIIRIVPKAARKEGVRPVTEKGVVDWSHRWECRGHWRRFLLEDGTMDMRRLGKDRQGDYCVYGRTWVSEAVKGPEDKPLVKKTRVVVSTTEEK